MRGCMLPGDLSKAARCGEPSYVWRAGQTRRLKLIVAAAGDRLNRRVLENGCGVGMYVEHLAPYCSSITGLEYDFERAVEARQRSEQIINAAGEYLPFPESSFNLIISHEVLEHVQDDALALREMVRVLDPGGRIILFVPNRGYPFETHGIYWRGHYHFGNIPLINWLPRRWRDRLAPHVRVYTQHDLTRLFVDLPVHFVQRTTLFGAYDNLIVRFGAAGKALRSVLQWAERTPLRIFGLSHFWVVEKMQD
jgi:SAM-dependent methyltransferase